MESLVTASCSPPLTAPLVRSPVPARSLVRTRLLPLTRLHSSPPHCRGNQHGTEDGSYHHHRRLAVRRQYVSVHVGLCVAERVAEKHVCGRRLELSTSRYLRGSTGCWHYGHNRGCWSERD